MKKIWLHRVMVLALILSLCVSGRAQTYTIRIEKDTLAELSIDNRKIAKDSFYLYDKKLHEMISLATRDRMRKEAKMKQDMAMDERYRETETEVREQEAKLRAEEARMKQYAMEDAQRELSNAQAQVRESEERIKESEERVEANVARIKESEERAKAAAKRAAEDQESFKALIQDLVSQKIIPDKDSLVSLRLNEDGLMVNGKPQPESVFAFFRDKYVKGQGFRISYERSQKEKEEDIKR